MTAELPQSILVEMSHTPPIVAKFHLQPGSAAQSAELLLDWARNQLGSDSVLYLVSVDSHDTDAQRFVEQVERFKYPDGSSIKMQIERSAFQDPSHALNRDIDKVAGDWEIAIFLRSNSRCEMQDWDRELLFDFNDYFHHLPGLLLYGNGPGVPVLDLPPTPAFSRALLDAIGYAFDPQPSHDLGPPSYEVALGVARELSLCVFRSAQLASVDLSLPAPMRWAGLEFSRRLATGDVGREAERVGALLDRQLEGVWGQLRTKGWEVPRLSVLVCTVPQREDKLKRLLSGLQPQLNAASKKFGSGVVELLVDDSPAGQLSIGAKRNQLLKQARGDFACFVDDDDEVSPRYVDACLRACMLVPSCVDMSLQHVEGQRPTKVTHHSLRYPVWDKPRGHLPPYHLNPIRASIARQVGFPDSNSNEDRQFGEQLIERGLLDSEALVAQPLYVYHFNPSESISRGRHAKLPPLPVDRPPATRVDRLQPARPRRYVRGRYNIGGR